MAGTIKVNTAQVAEIAQTLEGINNKLMDELTRSKETINNLKSTWEGEGADATVAAYEEFSQKYFQTYYDIITSYVDFLRRNVDQGYFETETTVVSLADQFK
ncbi:WXG100 family type VII secretion target [Neobacillus sp. Marseille-QA0830]